MPDAQAIGTLQVFCPQMYTATSAPEHLLILPNLISFKVFRHLSLLETNELDKPDFDLFTLCEWEINGLRFSPCLKKFYPELLLSMTWGEDWIELVWVLLARFNHSAK